MNVRKITAWGGMTIQKNEKDSKGDLEKNLMGGVSGSSVTNRKLLTVTPPSHPVHLTNRRQLEDREFAEGHHI